LLSSPSIPSSKVIKLIRQLPTNLHLRAAP
jgi:hypothetical protein